MSVNVNEPMEKYKSVGGWLLFLCVIFTIISPLITIFKLVWSYVQIQELYDVYPGLFNLLLIDSALSLFLIVLGIRAGISLWRIKPGAVKIAKNYLLIFLVYSIIAIFLPFTAGLPSEANSAMIFDVVKGFIKSLIFFGIWYSYLNQSKRVKATYQLDVVSEQPVDLHSETGKSETGEQSNE